MGSIFLLLLLLLETLRKPITITFIITVEHQRWHLIPHLLILSENNITKNVAILSGNHLGDDNIYFMIA